MIHNCISDSPRIRALPLPRDRDDEDKGKNFRLDRISNDLDALRDVDPIGEIEARATICRTVEEIQAFVTKHGSRGVAG